MFTFTSLEKPESADTISYQCVFLSGDFIEMAESSSMSGKFVQFVQRVYVELLLQVMAIRNREVVHELRELARYFHAKLFSSLLDRNIKQITLAVKNGPGSATGSQSAGLVLQDPAGEDEGLPQSPSLAQKLAGVGVSAVSIDTRLDISQIVDAILLLLHTGGKFDKANPGFGGLGSGAIAASLISDDGMHRLGTIMHFRREEGIFEIQYYYVELFTSRLLGRLANRLKTTTDYRLLLTVAPWVGLVVVALGVLTVGLWFVHWIPGLAVTVVAIVLLGMAVTYLIKTIGAVQFDSRHRHIIFKEGVRKITAMSYFPVTNPNALIKLDRTGKLLYCNPATDQLLSELGFGIEAVEQLLPADYVEWIGRALDTGQAESREVSHNGRTFRFSVSPFPEKTAVLVAGTELTNLKKLQADLREANDFLEERVAVRTYELMLTQDVTIMSLSTLAESRDPVTGAHIARTRNYVKILAEHLVDHPRFTEFLHRDNIIDKLYRSAPLHDIGKVGTRDDILLKPGKLSDDEYDRMKEHTIIGGDALRWAEERLGSNSFLEYAREIAYAHHEKWDGSGYPYGLAGEAIPISARLMALADVYDALTNERCYKPAYSHEEAREKIIEGSGTHFDPAVVEAFLEAQEEFKEIAAGKVDPMI